MKDYRMTTRLLRLRATVGLLALMLLLAGCATVDAPKNAPGSGVATTTQTASSLTGLPKNSEGYVDLTVQQLSDALAAKDFTLVNVHVPYAGDLPKTDLSIPYDIIARQTNALPGKNALIVLYCRSGAMSTAAAKDLVGLGYTNVMELDGGMAAWEEAGLQVLRKQ
jgi:rhodanese-related sulfurtransferase